jgi:hypothetical protein
MPLIGAKERRLAWHALAAAAREEMKRLRIENPRTARTGSLRELARRSGYSQNLVSRALSVAAFVDMLAEEGRIDAARFRELPLPTIELIRRMCESDPRLSPAELAEEVLTRHVSVRALAKRRRMQARPATMSGEDPTGFAGRVLAEIGFAWRALEEVGRRLDLVTGVPGAARVVTGRGRMELVDGLVQVVAEGRLEFVAALEALDLGEAEWPRRRLIRRVARAAFAASFVARLFFVVRGSDRAVARLVALLDELGLGNVGVVRLDLPDGPVVSREPRGGPVPDRRDLLLHWATERRGAGSGGFPRQTECP